MGAIAGKDGKIEYGSNAMGYIDNWSLSIDQGAEEASGIGKDWKDYIATAKGFSGSASGSLDLNDTAQKAVFTELKSGAGTPATITLAVTTSNEFSGDCILTNVALGASHGGKVTFSFNFQGTGELDMP